LVSWGCAAALAAGLNPGDLILPERIVCSDGTPLDTDKGWRKRLGSKLDGRMPVYSGLLAESDRIVAGEDEKRAIFAATGAIALDMESAAAARAAHRFGLPFLAVRSIIDPVDVTIPPSIHSAFDENGALHVPKMLFHTLLHPADFLGVIRLGRHFGAAMRTLSLAAAIGRETNFDLA
jgi:adenosylhomocysteine nucleosidase